MNFSFFDSAPEFDKSHVSSRKVVESPRVSPTDSPMEAIEPKICAMADLGASDSDMEWEPTPLSWRRLLEQADVCFEHARQAEKGLKFSAACGLILTARELLRRSLGIDCSPKEHLALERAVIERMETSRHDLDRLLDLAVEVRLIAI